jgi:hypothetical protein
VGVGEYWAAEPRFGSSGETGAPKIEPETAEAELEGWGENPVASMPVYWEKLC